MKIKIKKSEMSLNLALGIFALLFLTWAAFIVAPRIAMGQQYNSTFLVNTTVNITNAAPSVFSVTIPPTINLNSYNNVSVECNFTVHDFDNNTNRANATLYFSAASPNGAPDQNIRYQNASCTNTSTFDIFTNFTCVFAVNYFANNGTWFCNATGIDFFNATNTNESNAETINPLLAIFVDEVLDYGDFGAGITSNDTLANITNAGNRDANISVEGYAEAEDDGLAMTCDFGSIPIGNERYSPGNGTSYGSMVPLSNETTMLTGFYVPQRISETQDSVNSTFWKLQIPVVAGGVCNGKILFTATDRGN